MKETGYITLWNVDCVFITENNYIIIIPKNKADIQKINSYFDDSNFIIQYNPIVGSSIALIERVEFDINHTIKLFPKYIVEHFHKNLFSGFDIMGEAIDDFFSPSRYFYDRLKEGVEMNSDLVYHSEVADGWTILFENKPITVTLSYGDILRRGTGSDLMLHPRLTVTFEQTSDTQYVYRVYSFIVRFLKIVRYDTKCGKLQIDLFCKDQDKISYNGYLHDFRMDDRFCIAAHDVEYGCYKPYVQRFLQFAADNPEYAFFHYPKDGNRYRGRHYSAVDFLNIFSAFESECHASPEIYENVDTTKIQSIKDCLVSIIDKYPNTGLSNDETAFVSNARANLLKQGTEFGQRKKIKNAYGVLKKALERSIENIFFLPAFRCKGDLTSKNLNEVVEFLTGQRGAIAHGRFSGVFSDVDAQKIHFLEILTYAQMLKRIGLDDKDIERVVGVLFGCNYVFFKEKYH